MIYAGKVDHGFFYSAAPPLENSRYRFENVALAATGEVGSLGSELLPRCSARLRQEKPLSLEAIDIADFLAGVA